VLKLGLGCESELGFMLGFEPGIQSTIASPSVRKIIFAALSRAEKKGSGLGLGLAKKNGERLI
jgi:hypothetical protein